MSVLPSLCIWVAFLLPAHSMAGLYSYKNDSGIYMYLGMFIFCSKFPYLTFLILKIRLHAPIFNGHTNSGTLLCPLPTYEGVIIDPPLPDCLRPVSSRRLYDTSFRHQSLLEMARSCLTPEMDNANLGSV